MKTTVLQATPSLMDAFGVRPDWRQQDVNEFVLLSGQRVEDSLKDVDLKLTRVCVDENGQPLALWGLAGSYAWLIATRKAERYARAIQKHWKAELSRMAMWLGPGSPLFALNLKVTTNRRWHEALGFKVEHEDELVVLYRRDFSWVR